MKKIIEKYKDMLLYAVFGVLTTLVNIASYWICAYLVGLAVMVSTVIAWVTAVLFAYGTNRKWVFHSEAEGAEAICKELVYFFTCRLVTGMIDWGCMFVFADVMCFNDVAVKTLANILVILLNYVASKFVIFRHKKKDDI